ncbi:minor capsid protein [Metabacillus sp. 22489]|uniref:minor capsid protein n=1 Tax=Metabacillus sp. 22489 TaxID=3453928 RepID=UPI003F85BDDF
MNKQTKEFIDLLESEIVQSDEEFKKMLFKYIKTRDSINHYLAELYIKYAVNGGLNYLHLKNNGALNKFKKYIEEELEGNAAFEIALLTSILTSLFKRSYENISDKLRSLLNVKITTGKITKALTDEMVHFDWSGITYEQRIVNNHSSLFKTIWSTFVIGIQNGESMDTIAKKFNKHFNSKANHSQYLQETEVSRLLSSTMDKIYKDNKISQVVYQSVLEKNTCGECAALHDEVFYLDDPFRPIIPRHSKCKCFYIPENLYF